MEFLVRTMKVPATNVDANVRRIVRESCDLSTRAFNAALIECQKIDSGLWGPKTEKIPKCPKLYTYPSVKELFHGSRNVCASVTRQAEKTYKQFRFDMWTLRATLPTKRHEPWPIPIANTKWLMREVNVVADCLMIGGEHCEFTLRGGSNYARQLAPIKSILDGGPGKIGDSRVGLDRRGNVVFYVSVSIPKRDPVKSDGELHVKTQRDAFIVAAKERDSVPFTINADHVFGWIDQHKRRQQRLSQDSKSGVRRKLYNRRDIESRKYQDRIKSFIEETTAHIVKYASRRKCGTVLYDDTIRSYMPEFQWFVFCQRLKDKCEQAGIRFEKTESIMDEVVTLDDPHVYFLGVVDNGTISKVKIGMTTQQKEKRKSALETQSGAEMIYLAADKKPKTKLRQAEKMWHSQFAEHRGIGEYFAANPVIGYLRETGCLGNTGNISQISQYVEV